jgi:hypothetical protein
MSYLLSILAICTLLSTYSSAQQDPGGNTTSAGIAPGQKRQKRR